MSNTLQNNTSEFNYKYSKFQASTTWGLVFYIMPAMIWAIKYTSMKEYEENKQMK
jgi:hypothetical protein